MKRLFFKISLIFAAFLISGGITAGAFLFLEKKTNAITDTPFGGRIIFTQYCSCSENWWILVGPPRPGAFVYQPAATELYRYYQIYGSGPWVLGTASVGGVCMQVSGPSCTEVSSDGVINMVGTSLQ